MRLQAFVEWGASRRSQGAGSAPSGAFVKPSPRLHGIRATKIRGNKEDAKEEPILTSQHGIMKPGRRETK
jgi:hypothetical protein